MTWFVKINPGVLLVDILKPRFCSFEGSEISPKLHFLGFHCWGICPSPHFLDFYGWEISPMLHFSSFLGWGVWGYAESPISGVGKAYTFRDCFPGCAGANLHLVKAYFTVAAGFLGLMIASFLSGECLII